ncbi:zf-PARP-domain-containing protein, partial [Wilcoxina mikolae CBS 423.85]
MPTQYRVENAKSGRAKCKATTCDHAVIKKDELRQGTWVEIGGNPGGFTWKHWGCVTAKVLGNMINSIKKPDGELDFNMCDGFSELKDDASREMVKAAFERGYVSDEAWLGPPGGNRPNPPKSPRKKKTGDDENEGSDTEAEPPAEKPKRGRKKAAPKEGADVEEEAPAAKKAAPRGRGKKVAKDDAEAPEDQGP